MDPGKPKTYRDRASGPRGQNHNNPSNRVAKRRRNHLPTRPPTQRADVPDARANLELRDGSGRRTGRARFEGQYIRDENHVRLRVDSPKTIKPSDLELGIEELFLQLSKREMRLEFNNVSMSNVVNNLVSMFAASSQAQCEVSYFIPVRVASQTQQATPVVAPRQDQQAGADDATTTSQGMQLHGVNPRLLMTDPFNGWFDKLAEEEDKAWFAKLLEEADEMDEDKMDEDE